MTFAVYFHVSLAVILMIASGHLRCHADDTGVLRGDERDGKTTTKVVNGNKPADRHGAEEGAVGVIKPMFSDSGTGSSLLDFDHGLNKLDGRVGATPEMRVAWRRGAIGKITLRVIDDAGNPVPKADVKGGFYVGDDKGVAFETSTDARGYAAIEGRCASDMNCRIDKQGFYRTRFVYRFSKPGYDCVKEGRWLPWNPMFEVVLKRRVNPVAMYVRPNRKGLTPLVPPCSDQYIGFDLEKGDWVRPHGDGIHHDIYLRYEYKAGSKQSLYYRAAVHFMFTNKHDGAYAMTKDSSSAFQSDYHADTNAVYSKEMAYIYDRLTGVVRESSKFPESGYLVLRVRSKTDRAGNLISAHYAKMYGPIAAGAGGIYMGYYFNHNENDPNLEADTTRNLLNPVDLGFDP